MNDDAKPEAEALATEPPAPLLHHAPGTIIQPQVAAPTPPSEPVASAPVPPTPANPQPTTAPPLAEPEPAVMPEKDPLGLEVNPAKLRPSFGKSVMKSLGWFGVVVLIVLILALVAIYFFKI